MDANDAVERAALAASQYLDYAIGEIDTKFGQGYAEANPGLVGDFMKAAALESIASQINANAER